jgi:SAM-dependent methyltransferase
VEDEHVAPDGSPVAIYLAVPAGGTPTLIHDAIPAAASILELGCGAGRITRVLVAYGHAVTAVDDSPEMLAHVTGARTVCADLWTLELPDRFDTVVAGSHLINAPDAEQAAALLGVCRRHLAPGGTVLVERYPPGFLAEVTERAGGLAPVETHFERLGTRDGVYHARVTYRLGERTWVQEIATRDVADDDLDRLAAGAGLQVVRHLDDARTWVQLAVTGEQAPGTL